jgi:hypothetical protein
VDRGIVCEEYINATGYLNTILDTYYTPYKPQWFTMVMTFYLLRSHKFTSLCKKYPTLDQEKKVVYLGGSIPNPLQSRPFVTPHT